MSVIRWNTDSTLLRVVRTKDMSSGFSDRAFVPMTDAEIFQWLRLVSNVCLDRGFLNYPFRVVYSDSLPSQFPSRVEIRVQGILESGALLSSVFVSRPQCVGYERVRWIQLVHGNDDNKEKFQAQIRALRAISDACKLQLSLPPSQLCLPNAIYLRRRQPERDPSVVPLIVYRMDELSGSLHTSSVHDLGTGDLLDINVYVDVTVYRAEDSIPRAAVYFSFDRIVRVGGVTGPRKKVGAFLDNHFLDHRYPEEENAGYTAIEAIDRPLTGAQERLLRSLPPQMYPG